jgi:hypothetical protein
MLRGIDTDEDQKDQIRHGTNFEPGPGVSSPMPGWWGRLRNPPQGGFVSGVRELRRWHIPPHLPRIETPRPSRPPLAPSHPRVSPPPGEMLIVQRAGDVVVGLAGHVEVKRGEVEV